MEPCAKRTNESSSSAEILRDLDAYAGKHGISLCPHATLDTAGQKRQMKLHPTVKCNRCYVTQSGKPRACNSETPLVLVSGGTITRSENHCPLCQMSTANTTRAISREKDYATHNDSCSECNARYSWMWFSFGQETGNRHDSLWLSVSRSGSFNKPTDDKWLNSLEITGPVDPRGDPETNHLLWCDDRSCSTFRKWGEVG